ncbi:MAG TPA: PDZ domain-containing protein [Candidatus Hydrogenedentes bacterium]|nr:PDZ domain-containing protein [Candidatus Hydrogenedentota bacterium]HPG70215.1 PDZ domain-containing protein [Candidatus Hydrogenedentota bacterium]
MLSNLAAAVFLTLSVAGSASGDGFDQVMIDAAFNRVAPAVGLLTFTSEITKSASGELSRRAGNALGLVIARDGLLITHGHILQEDREPVNIRFTLGRGEDEQEYDVKLLKKPDDINICFLRLVSDQPLDLPYVTFRSGGTLSIGEPLMIVGVLSETLDNTQGVFFARVGAILDKPRVTYCLDEALRFGFVTGPVVNTAGEVVGVVGFDLSVQEGGELYVRSGHPLVYQTDLFRRYIDEPPGEQEAVADVPDAWLGVFTQPLTDDFAEYWGMEKKGGVIISSIVSGSPADKAGLKTGDVVVDFNGMPVRSKLDREVLQFTKLVRETGAGQPVPMTFLREGQPTQIEVMLEPRPKPASEAIEYEDPVFGLTVRELTTDVRILLNLPDTVQGVIIRRVKSGSTAQRAGMRSGIIILNFERHPVTNIDDFKAAVDAVAQDRPNEISVFCRAGAVTGFFRLEPRWNDAAGE